MLLWASVTVALFVSLPIHTWAKVVDSFDSCSEFFYQGREPQGFDQNTEKICQKLFDYSGHSYATLYSPYNRIPLYSAYTFDYGNNQEGRRSGNWFIEPQLAGYTVEHMDKESNYNLNVIKNRQAINADYSKTGYDRGHLNPNSFQNDDGRDATFTLTNSAPMDACFNRVQWKNCEASVKNILRGQDPIGTAYLVTGTVPDSNNRIPKQGDSDDTQGLNRVSVPSHIWTAVCYIHPDEERKSFSFGFIGENKPHGSIEMRTVPELTHELSQRYQSNNLKIFEDDCFSQNSKSQQIVKSMYSKLELSLADRVTMSPYIMNILRAAASSSGNRKRKAEITDIKIKLVYDSVESWHRGNEEMKFLSGIACMHSTPGLLMLTGHDELRYKRQTSDELVCRLVPENLDGCSTSCLYNEEAGDYYCSTGSQTKPCSPTYSDVTVEGKKCKNDHTCGKHGYNYYWCNTDDGKWGYCSPPPPLGVTETGKRCRVEHNCGTQMSEKCVNEDGNTENCCRRADRFSALNGKICKSDHPCDYNDNYDYLWCHTTDGKWDYCCTR